MKIEEQNLNEQGLATEGLASMPRRVLNQF